MSPEGAPVKETDSEAFLGNCAQKLYHCKKELIICDYKFGQNVREPRACNTN